MIDYICEKSKCTACFACQNVCPSNAIELKEDENGCTYPEINDNCIDCGLCQSTCPANTPVELNAPKSACAAYCNNSNIRKDSTSGGVIYCIANAFDGIVYGAAYVNGLEVECIRIEDKYELKKTQSSKYVHSYINNQYQAVKEDLKNGKRVLFTGTPCQIAGLRAYLKKDYDNLYTIDFVCHGIMDRRVLKDFIYREFPKADKSSLTVRFRDEKGYHMTVSESERLIGEIPFNRNFYYHAFLEGWGLRENCHTCPYAQFNRASDLTACDCWGSENSKIKEEMKNGLNGILLNTDKGRELLNSVKENVTVIECSLNEAENGPLHLQKPSPETDYSKRFRELNKKHGASYALKNTVLKKKLVFTLRKLKNAGNSNN